MSKFPEENFYTVSNIKHFFFFDKFEHKAFVSIVFFNYIYIYIYIGIRHSLFAYKIFYIVYGSFLTCISYYNENWITMKICIYGTKALRRTLATL